MYIKHLEAAIESILFASGEPVTISRLAAVLGVDKPLIVDTAMVMSDKYEEQGRGLRLVRLDDSLQLCSAPEFADIIRQTLETGRQPKLSQPALEVLSVIAYFQPVTKAYIEQVRGVDCTYTIGLLQTRGLIEAKGRLSVPGRPMLYATTPVFLRTFGIESLDELPQLPPVPENQEGQIAITPLEPVNVQTGENAGDE